MLLMKQLLLGQRSERKVMMKLLVPEEAAVRPELRTGVAPMSPGQVCACTCSYMHACMHAAVRGAQRTVNYMKRIL